MEFRPPVMTNISFENTEIAFKYKSDKELKRAKFLFSTMAKPLLVKLGTKITPFFIKANFTEKSLKTRFCSRLNRSLEISAGVALKISSSSNRKILTHEVNLALKLSIYTNITI